MLQALVPAAHGIGISAGTAISPPVPLWQRTHVATVPPATQVSWPETTGLAGAWSRAFAFIGGHPVLTSLATLGALFLTHGLDHSALCQAAVLVALPSFSDGSGGSRGSRFDDLPGLTPRHALRNHPLHGEFMDSGPYGRLYEGLLAARRTSPERYDALVQHELPWNKATRRQLKKLGIQLRAWDQGSDPLTMLLLIESMADQSGRLHEIWSRWFHTIWPTLTLPEQLFSRLVRRMGFPITWDAALGSGNFDRVLQEVVRTEDQTTEFIRLARVLQDLLARRHVSLHLQPAGLASRRIRVGLWKKDPLDTSLIAQFTSEGEEDRANVRAYLPFFLADEACRFVVASCGDEHVLSALLIAARTERGRPVLVVDHMRAIPALQHASEDVRRHIIIETLNYVVAYARAAGFGQPVIDVSDLPEGTGSHTPSPPFQSGTKVHPRNLPFGSILFTQARGSDAPGIAGASLAAVRDVIEYHRFRMRPLDYLYRSDVKVFDEESLARRTDRRILDHLHTAYHVAYHLLENKPVDAIYAERFGRALQSRYPALKDQETYCVYLQSCTSWRQAKRRMDRFLQKYGPPA